MTFYTGQTKLIDCDLHGPTSELFLVEGDSASRAVSRLRDQQTQAVLPMQGKPMNALKASAKNVRTNAWFNALVDALGIDWNEQPQPIRYGKVLFLFDPDADGIHCSALMLLFFGKYLPWLLQANRVAQVKPPLFEITADGFPDAVYAYSESHRDQLIQSLLQKDIVGRWHRYRGLASINASVLRETCIDPASRTTFLLQLSDVETARAVFGPRRR